MIYYIRLYLFHSLVRMATWICPGSLRPVLVLDDGDIWGLGSIWLTTEEEEIRLVEHDHRPAWMMKECPERVFEL